MTVTGQLIPLPVLPPIHIGDHGREPMDTMDRSASRRPRIYRIPRIESWASSGIYGADGRMSYEGAAGQQIDVLV